MIYFTFLGLLDVAKCGILSGHFRGDKGGSAAGSEAAAGSKETCEAADLTDKVRNNNSFYFLNIFLLHFFSYFRLVPSK